MKQLGTTPLELVPPILPPGCRGLYDLFLDLADCRELGERVVGPLTHQEIESYCALYRIQLTPFEVRALRRIDRVFVSVNTPKSNSARESKATESKARK